MVFSFSSGRRGTGTCRSQLSLRSPINLKSGAVLRGSRAADTHPTFRLNGKDAITAADLTNVVRGLGAVSGYQKGSTEITVADASSFVVPTFAEIQQSNDPEIMYTDPYFN